MLNTEVWKNVEDLPYEVSSLGNVRRSFDSKYKYSRGGNISPYTNRTGYLAVNLYIHSKVHKFLVHRLVALAFIPNTAPEEYTVINHLDGNRLNNDISNLEWCTQSQNMKHAWDSGLVKNRHANASNKRKGSSSIYKGVSWSSSRNRWCVCVGYKGKTHSGGRFNCELEAAKAYDLLITKLGILAQGYSLNFS